MKLVIKFCGYDLSKVQEEDVYIFKEKVKKSFRDLLHDSGIEMLEYPSLSVRQVGHSGVRSIKIIVQGIDKPDKVKKHLEIFNSKMYTFISKFLGQTVEDKTIEIIFDNKEVSNNENIQNDKDTSNENENDFVLKSQQYVAKDPQWSFEQIVLPDSVLDELETALNLVKYEPKVFGEWGLDKIEPFSRSALNFYGPPGTGKTMAAHAIASKLEKKILVASYAQIESKYHGEGPKNVEAIFIAAQRDEAVLFIDEADSLLSKRLQNVTQGSEQAINSMRSQLLICLEKFKGIVIFATNLVKNYDYAFETRIKSINFVMPDYETRLKIWKTHLLPTIPLDKDVDIEFLAKKYEDFCGRDIKNALVSACISAVVKGKEIVSQENLIKACDSIVETRKNLRNAKDYTENSMKDKDKEAIKQVLEKNIKEKMEHDAKAQ